MGTFKFQHQEKITVGELASLLNQELRVLRRCWRQTSVSSSNQHIPTFFKSYAHKCLSNPHFQHFPPQKQLFYLSRPLQWLFFLHLLPFQRNPCPSHSQFKEAILNIYHWENRQYSLSLLHLHVCISVSFGSCSLIWMLTWIVTDLWC